MKQIIIAQRGWVFAGIVVADTKDIVVIQKAVNIRRYGTTRGLGQLALSGTTEETILDEFGTVSFHPLSIIARIDITAEAWEF